MAATAIHGHSQSGWTPRSCQRRLRNMPITPDFGCCACVQEACARTDRDKSNWNQSAASSMHALWAMAESARATWRRGSMTNVKTNILPFQYGDIASRSGSAEVQPETSTATVDALALCQDELRATGRTIQVGATRRTQRMSKGAFRSAKSCSSETTKTLTSRRC